MAKAILSLLLVTVPTLLEATPIRSRAIHGKRGVAFENGAVTKLFHGLTWGYNWNSNGIDTAVPGLFEYVPMLHSDKPEHVNGWQDNVAAAVEKGAEHILSFNEPDQCGGGGSCMTDVGRTVAAHSAYVQPIAEQYPDLKIGAPAVTNGVLSDQGTVMGTEFLRPFIEAADAQNLKIDFVVAHWYDTWPADPTQAGYKLQYFKDHLWKIYQAGGGEEKGRKVWITEFGIWEGDQIAFLSTVMPWLDSQPWIERYAFHFAKPGVLVNYDITGLTPLGITYAST